MHFFSWLDSVELPVKHGRLKRSNSSVSIDVRKMEVNLKWASKPKKWFKKVGRKFSVGKTKESQTKVPSTKNLSQQQEGDVESNNLEESYYNESAMYMQLSKVDNEETDLSSNPLKSLSGQEEEINEPLSHGKEDKMQLIMSQLVAQSTDIKEFRQIVIKSFCDLQKGVDEVTLKGSNIEVLQLKQQLADEKANFTQELQKQEELQRSTNQVSVDLKEKTIFLEAKAKEKESEILQLKQQLADEKANFTQELQKQKELQRSTNQVMKEKTTLFEAKAKEKESEILQLKQQLADEKANLTHELQKNEELQRSTNQVTVYLKEKTTLFEAKAKEKESEILQLKQQLADEKANLTHELQKNEELQRSTNQVTVYLKEKTTLFEAKAKEKESEILQLKQQLADEKANFTQELQKYEELQRSPNQVTVDLKEKTIFLEAKAKEKESEILQLKQQLADEKANFTQELQKQEELQRSTNQVSVDLKEKTTLFEAKAKEKESEILQLKQQLADEKANLTHELQKNEELQRSTNQVTVYLKEKTTLFEAKAKEKESEILQLKQQLADEKANFTQELQKYEELQRSPNQVTVDLKEKTIFLEAKAKEKESEILQLKQQLADEKANFTQELQKQEELQRSTNQVSVDLKEKTIFLEAKAKEKESEILQLKQQLADEKANFTQELQKQEELQRSTNQVTVVLKEKTTLFEAKAKEKESEILQLKQQLADEKANFTQELQKNEELQKGSVNQVTVDLQEKTTSLEARTKDKESEILQDQLKQQHAAKNTKTSAKALSGCSCGKCGERFQSKALLQAHKRACDGGLQTSFDRIDHKRASTLPKLSPEASEQSPENVDLTNKETRNYLPRREAFKQEVAKSPNKADGPFFCDKCGMNFPVKRTLWHHWESCQIGNQAPYDSTSKVKTTKKAVTLPSSSQSGFTLDLQLRQQLADEIANFTSKLQKNEELQKGSVNQVTVDLQEKTTSLEARTKDKESEILQDQLKQQHAAKNTKTSAKALSGCSCGKCGERFQSKALLQAHKRACDGGLQTSFDRIDHKRASTLPKLSPEASEESPENVDLTNKETRNCLPRRGAFKQEVAKSPNKADGPYFCDKCGMDFLVKKTLWHHWESCQSGKQAPYDSTSKVKTTKKAVTLPRSGTAQNQRLDDKSHENTAENPHCEICNKEFTWDQRLELWDHREKCKKQ